ncbi:Sulfoxide reductase catalytic subunit YedY [Candidatus Norongarragalina meridionalis]|nr:Sulfoxide reductase catalytic subunit YedY [Candidatus Norongarragalina meridionalis]
MLIALCLCVALLGCVQQAPPATQNGTVPSALPSVEVREYNGERLSTADDFRENSISGPQYVDESAYRLKITGLVETPRSYTYDEVVNGHARYSKVVDLNCVEGWSVKILWEGVLVSDLLKEAKPLPGAKTVIFRAYDGYTSGFPLEYFNNDIIMAYKMNNATLRPDRGFPFQLVAESKWGYKWVKWITEIELSNDTNFKGYWESRGYAKEGDLNSSFIG